MRTRKPLIVGPAPTAFSTGHVECGTTVLNLQTETVVLTGDLECRRRAAQALAEAVGLSVVDTARIPGRQALVASLAGGEHLASSPL